MPYGLFEISCLTHDEDSSMKRRFLSFRVFRTALSLLAVALAPNAASGQAQATTGVIRGVATDSSGNPISAFITVRNRETNFTRTVRASDRGIYVTTLLPLGNYDVSARAVGYSPTGKSD